VNLKTFSEQYSFKKARSYMTFAVRDRITKILAWGGILLEITSHS
jgi:hypothetical protein